MVIVSLVVNRATLVTSDYVVDESLALLEARIGSHAALKLLEYLDDTTTLDWEWVGSERFQKVRPLFQKLGDQGHSFTDCSCLVIARERKIEDMLTSDRHFRIHGLKPVLAWKGLARQSRNQRAEWPREAAARMIPARDGFLADPLALPRTD